MKQIYRFFAVLASAVFVMCACQPALEDTVLELTDPDMPVVTFSDEHQSGFVLINCNRTWKASSSEPWLELETTRGGSEPGQPVKFRLAANEGYGYRECTVTVDAGKARLEFVVRQMPVIIYYINENFDSADLVLESDLPSGWYGDDGSSLDSDGDGYCWRCCRDPNTKLTYAYSMSYNEDRGRALRPDNWMTSPRFIVPSADFSLRWDAMGYDSEYLGDKYEVYIATYTDGYPLETVLKVCEEVTTSADVLTSHQVSLADFVGERICIAFHHFDSYNLSRVLITNVEVSNR